MSNRNPKYNAFGFKDMTAYEAVRNATKYRNVKTTVDDICFDSKAEARRYCELKLLKQAGEIRQFNMQPSFRFESGIRYVADFMVCGKGGEIWVEDVKGVETAAFKNKRKLFEYEYPYLELRLIK